jgi:hypothetical protein
MSDVITALKQEYAQLEVQKAVILEQRDKDIAAAKAKYVASLKEITRQQGVAKRMMKSAEKLHAQQASRANQEVGTEVGQPKAGGAAE